MTVLVTGGAGYIGSHTVHALVDAGERVVVLDNLSTGFATALPTQMLPIVGDVGDQALVAELIEDHGVEAIIHFAGSTVVPESVKRSARLLPQQHRQLPRPDRGRGQGRRSPFHLFLDRRGLRQSGARAGRRGRSDRADLALRLVEADDRDHAARRQRRARARPRRAALLQCRRRRPANAHRAVDAGRHASDQGRGRGRARPARRGSTSTAPTIRRRTAPASAISSMSAISRARILRRCAICARAAPARRSIAATAAAIRCAR